MDLFVGLIYRIGESLKCVNAHVFQCGYISNFLVEVHHYVHEHVIVFVKNIGECGTCKNIVLFSWKCLHSIYQRDSSIRLNLYDFKYLHVLRMCYELTYMYKNQNVNHASNLPPTCAFLGHLLYFQISVETSSSFFVKRAQDMNKCVYLDFVASNRFIHLAKCLFKYSMPHFTQTLEHACIESIAWHIRWTLIHSSPTKNKHMHTNMSRVLEKVLEALLDVLKLCMLIYVQAIMLYNRDIMIRTLDNPSSLTKKNPRGRYQLHILHLLTTIKPF